ncbi:HAD family phosphatase [Eubacterium sp. AM05-23]|uniref:HAD family hydrolase n=1 Tax=Eubacterium TaxID=1730 RepID=UPI0007353007|nr:MULTISPECIES: HAD family phosphatase [Eubacterium]ALU13332.1 HAD superfamily hydrolase [Eubacterium limosum]RHO61258.1 HAD family phosphatase [Eubacterium sp. AM05-23]
MKNIEDYKAVIFDFDGTLVDSMGLWHSIDHIYLERHHKVCPETLPYEIAGKSFTETAEYFKERFELEDSIEDIKAEWVAMSHEEYLNHVHFKPGALRLIRDLHSRRQRIAIATSNNRETTEAFLQKHNVLSYFDILCFTTEVGAGKPNPAVFNQAAQLLSLTANNCLVFEDTLEGIQAAKAAGMDVIAVADLWQGDHLVKIKNLADGFIQDFTDLE